MAATFTTAEILAATKGALLRAGAGLTFAGVSTDSRTCQTGELFIPLKGEKHDGHEFIPGAIEKGAGALVVAAKRPRCDLSSAPASGIEVADTLYALGELARFVRKQVLSAVLRQHGASPAPYPTAPDNVPDLERALEACLCEDVVLFSGGSSVGERDLFLDVVERMGQVLLHGAVKPGKPTLFGTISGKPVFGMPGYPTSCLSNAYMLLIGPLRKLVRLPEWTPRIARLPLGQRIVSTTGRHQFYTVRIAGGQAMPAFKASGDITSMSQADGYIEIPAQVDVVEKGEPVDVKLF